MDIAVIGAGKWGQALSHAFSEKNRVVISSRRERDLPNFIPLKEALEYEYLVMAIPTQFVRKFMRKNFKDKGQKILVSAKGIEVKSGKFLNEIYGEFLPNDRLAFLGGPSFAVEVLKSLPTALVVSSENLELADRFANAMPSFIKAYSSDDVAGT